jgi:penicillin-insensitive murein endopeptidase
VRIGCPPDSTDCKTQPATPTEEGCGAELDAWFKKKTAEPPPSTRKPLLMSALPQACRQVLTAQ